MLIDDQALEILLKLLARDVCTHHKRIIIVSIHVFQ